MPFIFSGIDRIKYGYSCIQIPVKVPGAKYKINAIQSCLLPYYLRTGIICQFVVGGLSAHDH